MTKQDEKKIKYNVTSNQKKEKTVEDVKAEAIESINNLLGDEQFIDGEEETGYNVDFSKIEAVPAEGLENNITDVKTYSTDLTGKNVMIEGVVFKDTIEPEVLEKGYQKQLPADFKYTISNLAILDEDGNRIAHKFSISSVNYILRLTLKNDHSLNGPVNIKLLGNLDVNALLLKIYSDGEDVTDKLDLAEVENNLIVRPKSEFLDFQLGDVALMYSDVMFYDIGRQEVTVESLIEEAENLEKDLETEEKDLESIKEEENQDKEVEEVEEVEEVKEVINDQETPPETFEEEDAKFENIVTDKEEPVKKSGKLKFFTFAAIILSAVGGYYVGTGAFGGSSKSNEDVVKVGTKVYTNNDVVDMTKDVNEVLNKFEGTIINKEIISQYGTEDGKKRAQATFDEEKKRLGDDLLPSLQRVGVKSEEEYLDGLIYQEAMANYIDTKIKDSDIEAFYKEWIPNQGVKVQFAQTKEDADKVVKAIQESEGESAEDKVNSYAGKNEEVYLDYEMGYGMSQVTNEDFAKLSKLKPFESGVYKMPENVGDNEYVVVTMITPSEKGSLKDSKEEVKNIMIQSKFQDPEGMKKTIYKDLKIEPISDFGKKAFDPTRN